MFEIGFTELLLVAVVALLVLGPERLPQAMRTAGLWIGRMRRSFNAVKNEIEREIGMDEIRRQLHNEAVMEELRRIERDVKSTASVAAGRSTGTAALPTAGPGEASGGDSVPAAGGADHAPATVSSIPGADRPPLSGAHESPDPNAKLSEGHERRTAQDG